MTDFSVVSGSAGPWKPSPLALDGKDWNRGTLLAAFENTLTAYGLTNTLSNARLNSSHISALVRQKFIDCILQAAAHQSLSVDYVVP